MTSQSLSEHETRVPLLAGDSQRRRYVRPGDQWDAERGDGTFSRNLGAVEAFAIVISIVIGSGVFTSPGSIDSNVPSPGTALIVWLVGGILAWTGASTLAELGTAIPGEGGVQSYLQHAFGDAWGFLAAWTWIVAVMPATLAILSIVFVESIYSAVGVTDQAETIEHKLLSILILVVVTLANSVNTKASTRLNNLFVATKFAAIVGIVAAGVSVVAIQSRNPEDRAVGGRDWFTKPWFAYRDTLNPDGSVTHWDQLSLWRMFGHYSTALYGALWAYSGWDKAVYVSAEMSSPARQLPLAINTAVPTVISCFITANTAYYILLPWHVVSETDSVAVTAISRLLGSTGGLVAASLICLVVAGSLLGNSFVASRMAVAAARKEWLPSFFAVVGRLGICERPKSTCHKSPYPAESDAPINALALSAALTTLYIIFGDFRTLVTLNGIGEYSFFFITVVAALVLRFREPDLPRPYKTSLLFPVTFALVSGFVVVRGSVFAPLPAGVLVAVWLLGIVLYRFTHSGDVVVHPSMYLRI